MRAGVARRGVWGLCGVAVRVVGSVRFSCARCLENQPRSRRRSGQLPPEFTYQIDRACAVRCIGGRRGSSLFHVSSLFYRVVRVRKHGPLHGRRSASGDLIRHRSNRCYSRPSLDLGQGTGARSSPRRPSGSSATSRAVVGGQPRVPLRYSGIRDACKRYFGFAKSGDSARSAPTGRTRRYFRQV